MESIFILISFVENENKKKDLHYLVGKHKEAIIDMDIRLSGLSKEESKDFKPWLMVENNTRGIYLINKICRKFDPWVSFWLQTPVYPHQIPLEIKGVSKWGPKVEKMKLKII